MLIKEFIILARSNKEISVEVRETSKNTESFVELELVVNKEVIGTVQQEVGQNPVIITNDGKQQTVKSVDVGINELIMAYNLHN